jgi:hypothetical protein
VQEKRVSRSSDYLIGAFVDMTQVLCSTAMRGVLEKASDFEACRLCVLELIRCSVEFSTCMT